MTALLACAGSSSAALTPAQLEALVQQQAATITQLTNKLNTLQSTVNNLAPLGAIKDKLVAVRLGVHSRGATPAGRAAAARDAHV